VNNEIRFARNALLGDFALAGGLDDLPLRASNGGLRSFNAPISLLKKLDLCTKCRWNLPYGVDVKIVSGCSKRPSGKASVSEEARRTLRYVEPLRDARTPLADFFSILLLGFVGFLAQQMWESLRDPVLIAFSVRTSYMISNGLREKNQDNIQRSASTYAQ
jgi:hypothetical protein